jgi:hypothetical protein
VPRRLELELALAQASKSEPKSEPKGRKATNERGQRYWAPPNRGLCRSHRLVALRCGVSQAIRR